MNDILVVTANHTEPGVVVFKEEHVAIMAAAMIQFQQEDVIYFFRETPIDYKELLRKYIDHVGSCGGDQFLNDYHRDTSTEDGIVFSDEEWTELHKTD